MKGTNKICTPFTLYGFDYNGCFDFGFGHLGCLLDDQNGSGKSYFKCDECIGQIAENTTNTLITEDTPTTQTQQISTIRRQETTVTDESKDVEKS